MYFGSLTQIFAIQNLTPDMAFLFSDLRGLGSFISSVYRDKQISLGVLSGYET